VGWTRPRDWGWRHAWTLNLSVRTDAVNEVGGFSTALPGAAFEDVELGWRLRERFGSSGAGCSTGPRRWSSTTTGTSRRGTCGASGRSGATRGRSRARTRRVRTRAVRAGYPFGRGSGVQPGVRGAGGAHGGTGSSRGSSSLVEQACSTAAACTAARSWPTATSTATTSSAACTAGTTATTRASASTTTTRPAPFTAGIEDDGRRCGRRREIAAWAPSSGPPALRPRRVPRAVPGSARHPEEPHNRYIQQLAARGPEQGRAPRPARRWACRAAGAAEWDDLQIVTAQLPRGPAARRRAPVDTTWSSGRRRSQAARPRDPALRQRHELRGAQRGGEGRARAGRRAGRHRHLLGRGRHAPEEQAANSRYFYELASAASAGPRQGGEGARRSTSRAGRAPRPAPAGTCRATR
jgi:hypothetical protein